MPLLVRPFTAAHAQTVCSWRYPAPFSVYNLPSWEDALRLGYGLCRADVRQREFCALCSGDDLVGFFRLKLQDASVLFAVGLAPEHCGRGLGPEAVRLALGESARRYASLPVRLEVRAFNRRAIRVYERAGFRETGRRQAPSPSGPDEFILMER